MLNNFKPWMLIPAKWAHDLSPFILPFLAYFKKCNNPNWQSVHWRNLHFRNPVGIAGGVDKNAVSLKSWWDLGAGFVEVGTITPLPQDPNPGKIMDRDISLKALWNKMGFPSDGADEVYYNIRSLHQELSQFPTPLFINIGKNRETPNDEAQNDYLFLMERFKDHADAFVVNISSPNTKGLRDLQTPVALSKLFIPIISKSKSLGNIPILVKLSPDMPSDLLSQTLEICVDLGVDGFVLTNTTLERPENCHFSKEGGLSGLPLRSLSVNALKIVAQTLGTKRKDLLIVSCGGIMTPDDVYERLQLGADLVEIYSVLVFEGPHFFGKIAKEN